MSGKAKWLAGGTAVGLLLVAAVGFAVFGGGEGDVAPAEGQNPPKEQTPEEIASYVASKAFTALPLDERIAYLQGLQEADPNVVQTVLESEKIPGERRQQARQNVREVLRERVAQHVKAYSELPPERRTAYLDEVIDDLRARKLVREAGTPDPRADRPVDIGAVIQRIRSQLEGTDPADRAKHIQFLMGMRSRMSERGFQPAFPGPAGPR